MAFPRYSIGLINLEFVGDMSDATGERLVWVCVPAGICIVVLCQCPTAATSYASRAHLGAGADEVHSLINQVKPSCLRQVQSEFNTRPPPLSVACPAKWVKALPTFCLTDA